MSRRILFAITGAWAVLGAIAIAAIFVVSQSGTTLYPDSSRGPGTTRTTPYQWDGSSLQLDNSVSTRNVGCTVVPENGPTRVLPAVKSRSVAAKYVRTEQSWFSGSATMTCSDTVTVRSGTSLTAFWLVQNRITEIAGVIIAFGPLIVAYVLTSERFKNA